ncbi:hypothetical protein NC651_001901 [Populus alba x Populus x berolinensis]|nr:hypothetical protein NC651_001901 [Populus alba x Populus x berolinensis]
MRLLDEVDRGYKGSNFTRKVELKFHGLTALASAANRIVLETTDGLLFLLKLSPNPPACRNLSKATEEYSA